MLLRSIQLTGIEEGEILGVDLWKVVSLRERNLRAAVALTERAQQDLARNCLTRYRYETEIGRMKAWKALYREGLLERLPSPECGRRQRPSQNGVAPARVALRAHGASPLWERVLFLQVRISPESYPRPAQKPPSAV